MNICLRDLTIIGSHNGLLPVWRQAIIWTNTELLSIGPLRTNFSEILIEIRTFSFKKMYMKMLSGKWRPFCLGLNVLNWFTHNCCHLLSSRNRWWQILRKHGVKLLPLSTLGLIQRIQFIHSWTKVYRIVWVSCKTHSKLNFFEFLELGIKPDHFSLNM